MKYIFEQHYSLPNMKLDTDTIYRAIVFEPKFELAELYAKYLRMQNLETYTCQDDAHLETLAASVSPHIIIYNIDNGYTVLKFIKHKSPSTFIITIGGDFGDAELDDLMAIGISGHINRKVTQPRDIGILAKQLLQY